MKYLRELLVLRNLKGTGKKKINRMIRTFSSVSPYTADGCGSGFDSYVREYLKNAGYDLNGRDVNEAGYAADETMERLEARREISAITCFDDDYPEKLRDLGDEAPLVLYVRTGNDLNETERRQIITDGFDLTNFSVIGSRWPEEHVLRNAPGIIKTAAEVSGRIVISGLARGCDSIGHRAALAAGVPTIAVMASGPDIITPAMNHDLAMEILEAGGTIITEYDPGTEAADHRYLERDRMLAALSDGVIVLECGMNSGTMKTVEAAVGLDRPVGCIRFSGGSGLSDGCGYIVGKMNAADIGSGRALREFLSDIPDAEERGYLTAGKHAVQLSIF